jgi:hypothetical protein
VRTKFGITLLCVLGLAMGPESDLRLSRPLTVIGNADRATFWSLKDLNVSERRLARLSSQAIAQQILDYRTFYPWMNYYVVSTMGLGIRGLF